jgi:hypothetical protein
LPGDDNAATGTEDFGAGESGKHPMALSSASSESLSLWSFCRMPAVPEGAGVLTPVETVEAGR